MLPTETLTPMLEHNPELPYRWSAEKAAKWFEKNGWLVGCNYIPHTAINQLEMWQEETFDPFLIDKELSWAAGLGFNTVRVFLHDRAYRQDPEGFLLRMDTFITICHKHSIKPLFVFWDSCWNPYCNTGKQPDPIPNVHNSGWIQSPGAAFLLNDQQHHLLEEYILRVVTRFKDDYRLLGWDLFNEPNHKNRGSYNEACKEAAILSLLQKTVKWVRSVDPVQPLTIGVFENDWHPNRLNRLNRFMLENSDWISFHCYKDAAGMEASIQDLLHYNRPILCTEYMARPVSTFEEALPVLKKYNVGAYCWGFVAGKTQTYCHWDSWGNTELSSCQLGATTAIDSNRWFHDVLQKDGTPHDEKEAAFLKKITGKQSSESIPYELHY